MTRCYRVGAALVAAISVLSGTASAVAEPAAPEAAIDPFPDIRYYDQVNTEQFTLPGGVWFIAPTGQNCGIWGLGNFGCAGDIPGAPAGTSHIGWINGDRAVHHDWSVAVRYPATQAQRSLLPFSKITHQGTTCAATPVGTTYCQRGPLRFLIEPSKTWLSEAWMDLNWLERGPASCSPPGGGPCYG